MKLGPEQMQILHQHLSNTLKNPCALCGTNNWIFDDAIFEVRQFQGGQINTGGLLKPMVSITCTNCGAVSFINAFKADVIRLQQQEQPTETAVEGPKEEPAIAESELGTGG